MKNKLDKFESFIKGSLESHEVSCPESAWDDLQNSIGDSSSNFESFVKDSLNNHEVPYSSLAWSNFSNALDKAKPFYRKKWFLAVASVLLIGSLSFFLMPNNENNEQRSNKIVENQFLEEDNNFHKINEKANSKQEFLDNELERVNKSKIEPKNIIAKTINESKSELETNCVDCSELKVKNEVPDNKDNLPITPIDDNDTLLNKIFTVKFESVNQICEGESLLLKVDRPSDELNYDWVVNGEKKSNKNVCSINGFKAGVYSVELLGKDKEGVLVNSHQKTILVNELPKNNVSYHEDEHLLVNSHVFKTDENLKSIEWDFGNGDRKINEFSSANHTISYRKQGKYKVSYSIENENGCKASYEKNVIVKGYYNIRADHGFSPDGDGSLDYFMPEELKLINQSFEMVLFSRSGDEVFKTTDVNSPWDGKGKDGNMVPFGVYVWVVNLTNELGVKEQYKGTVTKATNN